MSAFIQSRKFNRLLERIRSNDDSLKEVRLDGRRIGDEGCRRLAEALRGNTIVAVLGMCSNGIGPEGAAALAGALDGNTTLTELWLGRNNISDEGATALAGALEGNTTLTSLSLGGNSISDEGYNSIGPAGAAALAGALEGNTTLTGLGLGRNNISDEGAAALAGALKGNTTLTWLSLGSNSIGPAGATALAGVLEGNASLTSLGLEYNSIGPAGAAALVGALEVNASLTELRLWGNNIGPLEAKVERLVNFNRDAPSPQEAHRLKVERRIGWMLLDSEDDGEEEDYDSEDDGGEEEEEEANYEGAVSLALAELDSFPLAGRRCQLFEKLLGSTERGVQVAASVDVTRAEVLYRYAADCGASPVALMNLLQAHESLCECRDLEHKLYPFMLLATVAEAGVGEVLEALLLNPSLVQGGLAAQDA